MAEKKEKRYVSDNAQLMVEWDWEKNNELGFNPKEITSHSGKKVWWICANGHSFDATIANRANGKGCPYCSGRYAVKGENDLQTVNPTLAKEWIYEKNNGLTPMDVLPNSNKKVWWKCSKGHEWLANINSRNAGSGCPYCSSKRVLKGYNDLQSVNSPLAIEWNYGKNNGLTPMDVLPNSNKKVWWKCSKGHEWQATISNRNNGNGCPYCAGQYVVKGENDLQTVNPTLAKEWNYEKNGGLMPMDVLPNSNKKVWWKCNKGHEWQATVTNRNKGNECPVCNSERKTSFPEYALVYYIEKSGLGVVHSYREKGYELDIYIPSLKIAIEYDGYYWHKHRTEKDLVKNYRCKKDGIKLYRIREGLPPLNDSSIDYIVQDNQKNWSKVLKEILSEITGTNVDVDLERDHIDIENLREYTEKENSLLFLNTEISKEWNYEKNGNLKPENFSANSEKKVWWKCSKGHEWHATIANRNSGRGCPFCSNKKVLKGYNDLQTVNPTLAKEWHYEKNNGLRPIDVTPNSNKKVWWKCNNGHEWETTINNRSNGNGCPYCSGRYVVLGENDLQTANPTLAKEWHYEKNNGLRPIDVTPNSNKKVWWKCNRGHEWQATIAHRNIGNGCPYCSGRYTVKGTTDLQTINPTLAKEWNYERNLDLKPSEISPGSNKKVWWKCAKGHEWQATVNNRSKGRGCPQCFKEKRKKIT
ncbi:MAG: hypothetical protein IKB36_04050 [Clostridia bacterium]|nr:hypothetical protein [Clostridia bacterium]